MRLSAINRLKRRKANHGMALAMTIVTVLIGLGLLLGFFYRANLTILGSKSSLDSIDADLLLDAALAQTEAKFSRAMSSLVLNNKLRFVNANATLAAQGERFDTLNNIYATDVNSNGSTLDEAQQFLQDMIVSQAYSSAGTLNTNSEFAYFSSAPTGRVPAFPSSFQDPNPSDNDLFEVRYSFSPLRVESQVASDPKQILFEYEYQIEVKAYGRGSFTQKTAESGGVIQIVVRGSPFSKWSLFSELMVNQNGSTLYFAGGDTSAQVREVYSGPVHINQTPNFLGHPTFMGLLTSGVAEASWNYRSISGYTSCPGQCPSFNGGKMGGVPTIPMPSAIFNTHRLAAGDTSSTASTNNNQPTVNEMKSFLAYHADGAFNQSLTSIPAGIYIPVNSLASNVPTGGIYVEGNSSISMNVVTGQTDFDTQVGAGAWANIQAAHRSCKFQKVKVTSGSTIRDVLIGDDPCNVTYVFNGSSYSSTPTILNGRPNGNIHVNGQIDSLGGQSRTRPAVATDFGITVSATKDVFIKNDLQYEDAEYVTLDSSGNLGSTVVANPWGAVGASGYTPSSAGIGAKIDSESHTILGIMSTQRNVQIYTSNPFVAGSSAPTEINLHAAIYTGNSSAYSSATGYGCGSTRPGCGFGVLNYASAPNMGNIKLLGSIAEYRDQTTATVSGGTVRGYGSVYLYDTRLLNTISPPAFPISNSPQAYGTVKPYRLLRLAGR